MPLTEAAPRIIMSGDSPGLPVLLVTDTRRPFGEGIGYGRCGEVLDCVAAHGADGTGKFRRFCVP